MITMSASEGIVSCHGFSVAGYVNAYLGSGSDDCGAP